jgi:hypothetical protein
MAGNFAPWPAVTEKLVATFVIDAASREAALFAYKTGITPPS